MAGISYTPFTRRKPLAAQAHDKGLLRHEGTRAGHVAAKTHCPGPWQTAGYEHACEPVWRARAYAAALAARGRAAGVRGHARDGDRGEVSGVLAGLGAAG